MNTFHFDGKVIYINPSAKSIGQGITISHYPADLKDYFFEVGLVVPPEIWSKVEVNTYDFIEVKGHYVTLNKNEDRKAKLLHIVDEIVSVVHE